MRNLTLLGHQLISPDLKKEEEERKKKTRKRNNDTRREERQIDTGKCVSAYEEAKRLRHTYIRRQRERDNKTTKQSGNGATRQGDKDRNR